MTSSGSRASHVVHAGASPPGPLHVCSVKERRRTHGIFVTGRGNNFETTHWTGIYPVSVFAL
eukprot:scaffold35119_cov56-Attheya_sp.AAC.2